MTTRMALAVLAIGPIGLAYSGVQRYLICGITIGAIKG
jgi:putative aldouronate transport system permease protein